MYIEKSKNDLVELLVKLNVSNVYDLKVHFNTQYDYKDSIGKRYRRQDAIGTPFCITVDYDSIKDNSVTLRNRDTMEQIRISVDSVISHIKKHTSLNNLLKNFNG